MSLKIKHMRKVTRHFAEKFGKPFYYREFIRSQQDYANLDTDQIETVCIVLGPYRNLTTLTASLAFLHPNCQVLNHGSSRILPIKKANFFSNYTEEKFNAFLRYSIYLSLGGKRGDLGGSITLGHAFQDGDKVSAAYRARFGDEIVKQDIRSFFWKESMKVTNYLRKHHIDFDALFAQNSKLRFLMPFRNPLDCAFSNQRKGHDKYFERLQSKKDQTTENILECIIQEMAWFLSLKKQYPNRFFYYTENQFGEREIIKLGHFLQLPHDEQWIQDVKKCYDLNPSRYQYSGALLMHYRQCLDRYLGNFPEVQEKLVCMVSHAS